jgi:hypothetical protein
MRSLFVLTLTAALLSVLPLPLAASGFTCTLSPAKDAVIVKTDNGFDHELTCTIDCRFTSPQGPTTVSCTQAIPANRIGWYVCRRPTGGKALEFAGGSESCE